MFPSAPFSGVNSSVPPRSDVALPIDDTVMNVALPPLPDLLVTSITAPATSQSGRSVPVSWTIRNDGPVAFTGTFEQAVALSSDNVIGDDLGVGSFSFTGTIAPGQTITQSHTINLPNIFSGNYRVVVTADSAGMLSEALATTAPVQVFVPSGLQPKLRRLFDGLVARGLVAKFGGRLETGVRQPLNATPQIAREVLRRFHEFSER